MKYWVFKAAGVELYAGAMAGGKGKEFWPRQIQLPIGATPLTGWVGSLVAVPEGSVPPGKILPLMTNRSPRFGPPTRVRQSIATSKVRTCSPAACNSARGLRLGATLLR